MDYLLQSDSFWALVGLILFFVVIFYFRVPGRVMRALDDRTKRIEQELSEARRLREEAQALLADYQRKRREAEAEAEQIVEDARRDAARMADDARAKLKEMIERRTEAAETRIRQAESQAIAEVKAKAADLAVAAAEDILRDRVSGDIAAKLTETSIETVRSRLN
jgi:F-type H+-transporting ATPase subunit b